MTNPTTSRSIALFLLLFALILGAYFRILPSAQNDFPILDGGLFYAMTTDLLRNGWRLPLTTTYNYLNIPFAYPPLPFYLLGSIYRLTGIDLLILFRWIPALLSLLIIPAFYLIARTMLGSESLGALATLIFALLPRSWEWLIMGGGITRATGMLFFSAFACKVYQAFHTGKTSAAIYAGIWGSLVLLSHPERALHAATTALLFWLWWGRSREGIAKAFLIGSITLTIGALWWLPLLTRHGWEVLLPASQSAAPRWLFWSLLIQVNFTDETVPLLGLLAIYGLWWSWKEGKQWLAWWLLVMMVTDPRSAPHLLPIPTGLLAALALAKGIFPMLVQPVRAWEEIFFRRSGQLFFGYLLILMLFNAQSTVLELQKFVLSQPDREALAWVAVHTPPQARFLALDWYPEPTMSPLLEWFPVLAQRTNITTLQGREWLAGEDHFKARYRADQELKNCLYQDISCLHQWSATYGERFDYIYLALQAPNGELRRSALGETLRQAPEYQLVYQTPQVLIFQRR